MKAFCRVTQRDLGATCKARAGAMQSLAKNPVQRALDQPRPFPSPSGRRILSNATEVPDGACGILFRQNARSKAPKAASFQDHAADYSESAQSR